MTDAKIKTGVVFVRNGLWQVEVEKREYMITKQWPFHSILKFGRDENRRVKVKILNSTNVELLEVLERKL